MIAPRGWAGMVENALAREAARKAEDRSAIACPTCGAVTAQPTRNGGWIAIACALCRSEHEAEHETEREGRS